MSLEDFRKYVEDKLYAVIPYSKITVDKDIYSGYRIDIEWFVRGGYESHHYIIRDDMLDDSAHIQWVLTNLYKIYTMSLVEEVLDGN